MDSTSLTATGEQIMITSTTIVTSRISDHEMDLYMGGRAAYLAWCKEQLAMIEARLAGEYEVETFGELAGVFPAQSAQQQREADERRAAVYRGAIQANA